MARSSYLPYQEEAYNMPISTPSSLLDITGNMRRFCAGVLTQVDEARVRLREAQSSDTSGGDRTGLDRLLRTEEERLQQIRRQWEALDARIDSLNRKIMDLSAANDEIM